MTCADCGAPLGADQRYCLACGSPASPVRLAFLDVLQGERGAGGGEYVPIATGNGLALPVTAAAYPLGAPPEGPLGALRRYSGLLALVGVLLAALLVGLLLGHWIGGGGGAGIPAKQVVEVKGLGGALAASARGGAAGVGAGGVGGGAVGGGGAGGAGGGGGEGDGSSASGRVTNANTGRGAGAAKSEAAAEANEVKELQKAKAPPPAVKANPTKLQRVSHSTGKRHVEEVNALGDQPIETGH